MVLMFSVFVFLICMHVYNKGWISWKELEVNDLATSIVTIISILAVTEIAKRSIVYDAAKQHKDKVLSTMKESHYLIAILKDLKAKVEYIKTSISDGGVPVYSLAIVTKSIEERYETLLNNQAYEYIQGVTIDKITDLSGSIFGIRIFSDGLSIIDNKNPFEDVRNKANPKLITSLSVLVSDIDSIIEDLYKLRKSLEA